MLARGRLEFQLPSLILKKPPNVEVKFPSQKSREHHHQSLPGSRAALLGKVTGASSQLTLRTVTYTIPRRVPSPAALLPVLPAPEQCELGMEGLTPEVAGPCLPKCPGNEV